METFHAQVQQAARITFLTDITFVDALAVATGCTAMNVFLPCCVMDHSDAAVIGGLPTSCIRFVEDADAVTTFREGRHHTVGIVKVTPALEDFLVVGGSVRDRRWYKECTSLAKHTFQLGCIASTACDGVEVQPQRDDALLSAVGVVGDSPTDRNEAAKRTSKLSRRCSRCNCIYTRPDASLVARAS